MIDDNKLYNHFCELLDMSNSFSDTEKVYYKKYFQSNSQKINDGISILENELYQKKEICKQYVDGIISSIQDYVEYCEVFNKKISQQEQLNMKEMLSKIRENEATENQKQDIEKILESL